MRQTGDVILATRRARGLTQEQLCEQVAVTQAALSRYETNDRDPEPAVLERLAATLGVTVDFLRHPFRLQGAIAVDAHMRRQKTVKVSAWKKVEADLNLLRMRTAYLLERVPLQPEQQVPAFDPVDTEPADAARLVRAQWRMPIGPVRTLIRWMESAGVVVVEQDFATARIDGACQWAGTDPVVLINAGLPTDRKRWTLAHELGHLVLHADTATDDMEGQANAFAAELLTPEHLIRPLLHDPTIGRLADLKAEWGVSMQALFARAMALGLTTREAQTRFYKTLSARGWRNDEPGSDRLPAETPQLAASIGERLLAAGLSSHDIALLTGTQTPAEASPFLVGRRLQAV